MSTGAVLFAPKQARAFVQRAGNLRSVWRARGAGPDLHGAQRPVLPDLIFIDGRTGETLHSETFREEISTTPTSRPRPCPRTSS
jgi:hypothetical protein